MKKILGLILISGLFACGDDGPPPPSATTLIFPDNNSECTTGIDVGDTESVVTFSWSTANNTDDYRLNVTNLSTNSTERYNTVNTSYEVTINKATPYSWYVESFSDDVAEVATSSEWVFYNSGVITSYVPFPANLTAPESGSSISGTSVILSWQGSDLDNDITEYSVFLGDVNPPTDLVTTTSSREYNAGVSQNTTYYWYIVTNDSQGNSSTSSVYNFSVE